MLVLLLGGARSGKSDLALRLAAARPAPVILIATGEPLDDEMATRIGRHRAGRPAEWETIEASVEVRGALERVPAGATVILDCLTLWTANLLASIDGEQIAERAGQAARVAAARDGLTLAVSNEVGMGIVPDNSLARSYRDVLGRVNAVWAAVADRCELLVAGRLLELRDPDEFTSELAR